jgi:uncharacterized protein YdhG (YjbR/CyaY superfamily)
MKIDARTVEEYLHKIPDDRKEPVNKLRETIRRNIPEGFVEELSYGMIGYVVPHDLYPAGYHCDPELPLPFVNLASQKNFVALYHSGIYADKKLHDWFLAEYPKHSKQKLDMGKSCIRFKKLEEIPYKLIGELMQKISVRDWIDIYEKNVKRK